VARGDIALYRGDFAPTSVGTDVLAALSQRIARLNCDPRLVRYCKRYGVAFLGEACRLNFAPGRGMSDDREELGGLLNAQGLSFGCDPIVLGWEPPYWTDREWLAFLDRLVVEALDMSESRMRMHGVDAISRIGTLIRNMAEMPATSWMWFQTDFGKTWRNLRSGMIVPPTWQPPEPVGEP